MLFNDEREYLHPDVPSKLMKVVQEIHNLRDKEQNELKPEIVEAVEDFYGFLYQEAVCPEMFAEGDVDRYCKIWYCELNELLDM